MDTLENPPLQHQAQDAEGLRAATERDTEAPIYTAFERYVGSADDRASDFRMFATGYHAALAASPPQAETQALDREAVARIIIGPRNPVPATSKFTLRELQDIRWNQISEQERGEALWIADAILAATAVSQPPASRQGAGEVEALRAACEPYEWHTGAMK